MTIGHPQGYPGISNARAGAVVAVLIVAAFGLYFALSSPSSGIQSSPATTVLGTTLRTAISSSTFSKASSSWPTYQRDLGRSGFDPSEPPANNVKLSWTSADLDGTIYAQPLASDSAVIVATEGDSVYSISESNGTVLWRANLGAPVPRSELPCGDIDPTGITGTPVIDTATHTLYVVAFLEPPHHEVFALNLRNGAVLFHRNADPAGADPLVQQQRGALAFSSGMVYIPYGGLYGDCGRYHGWVVAVRANGNGTLLSYQVPTNREGGIWAPSGEMLDEAGNIFVATGNGATTSTFDFGNSVIKLSPNLTQLDWFAPSNWSTLNAQDTDLGSVGPSRVGPNAIFQIGKEGVGFLLKLDLLGGIGGQTYAAHVCSGAYGGIATAPPYLYVPCRDGLVALNVSLSGASFSVAWRGPGFNAGPPIVAGGVVWTIDTSNGKLYGLDAHTGQVLFTVAVGPVAHFSTLSSADGRIFVPGGKRILCFVLNAP